MLPLLLALAGPFSVLGVPQGTNLRKLAPIAPQVVMETTSDALDHIAEPLFVTSSAIYLEGFVSDLRCEDRKAEPYLVARNDGVLIDCRPRERH